MDKDLACGPWLSTNGRGAKMVLKDWNLDQSCNFGGRKVVPAAHRLARDVVFA